MTVLTNLAFLNQGQTFPPESQKPRLKRYQTNKQKYEGQSSLTNPNTNPHLLRLLNGHATLLNHRLRVNFQRKIALKIADFLFQETPTFEATPQSQPILDDLLQKNNLIALGYAAAIDAARYGDAIFLIQLRQGTPHIALSQPAYWFPVVDPTDLKHITHHILAWQTPATHPQTGQPITLLTYQIHTKGAYTHGQKILKADKIGATLHEETIQTGLADFAVIPLQNTVPSDTIFGTDDFTDVNPLIEELEIRLEQIAHILDKHANPTLAGPIQALDYDETTGAYHFRTGNYLPLDKDTPLPTYVTWDGQLEAAYQEIERLLHLIAAMSEMGAAIFDHDLTNRVNISGRALRLMYINVLAKTARMRKAFDYTFKKLITLTSAIGPHPPINIADLSIHWKDGLPNDPKEMAEIAHLRLAGQPSDTIQAQIIAQDHLTQKQAQTKTNQINPS